MPTPPPPSTPPAGAAAPAAPQPRRLIRVTRRAVLGGLGLSALVGASTAGYAAGIEPMSLLLTRYRPDPAAWRGGPKLRIAAIADLHAGGPNMTATHIARVVDLANAQNPDLIVLLGDYIATHRFVTDVVRPAVWGELLGKLRAPLGVHAILGNHDWWHGVAEVRAALTANRIPILENDAVRLGSGAERFWLLGLGDQLAYWLGPNRFRGVDDLPGTLAKVTDDAPVLLLAHEPDIFPDVPGRVALTLAGHTHGGQIRIPLLWPGFVPSSYGARFAYGHIVEQERHMIVSGGLGTSFVPARFGVPPEVLLIELGV